MYIEKAIFNNIQELQNELPALLKQEFLINESQVHTLLDKSFNKYLASLKDDLCFLVETNYVDKFYRDTLYNYFSSKSGLYVKNCIRISLFTSEISENEFRSERLHAALQEKFVGFIILRPTIPSIIGRSIISPVALKDSDFYSCSVQITVSIDGVKLFAEGFPHAAQDTENISCAETSIWSLMEYFGNKYAEYTPVLPSEIIKELNVVSFERQVPSRGLSIAHLSYALKKFGFGSVIYSRDQYKASFNRLMSTYVESGIPIIVAMRNKAKTINHALLCIGQEDSDMSLIDNLDAKEYSTPSLAHKSTQRNITIYDTADISRKFVFIDDNMPAYQKAYLESPAIHYSNDSWHTCSITHFIVPLYHKIYLEAFKARNFIFSFILGELEVIDNSSILTRIFLTSSRSYKNYTAFNNQMSENLKNMILDTSMPKFIWVAELSNKTLFKEETINGIILLDATEAVTFEHKPLILAVYNGKVTFFNEQIRFFDNYPIDSNTYTLYKNNLKVYNT